MENGIELLAPAGSIKALQLAILNGANAVYLGLGEHNARNKSSDFCEDNLAEWVRYSHFFGVKVYVTLNTLVKDLEMARVAELISNIAKSGADAIIAADYGVVSLIKQISNIPVHISTQAGVHNAFGAQFFKDLGADRVILARETLAEDIAEIAKVGIEIETFVQGALCVSFSGGCLLGSISAGCSGNRGNCNQPCRQKYEAVDAGGKHLAEGYLLSAADLCMADKVKELEKLGVKSLKIEGRLRRAEYVAEAVKLYRHILDGDNSRDNDVLSLQKAFNRGGYTDGYSALASKPIVYPDVPNHTGVKIGKVVSVNNIKGYNFAEIDTEHSFKAGDGLKFLRDGKECGGSDVTSVKCAHGLQVIPVSSGVCPGDIAHLTTDAKMCEFWGDKRPKRSIDIRVVVNNNAFMSIEGVCGSVSAIACSENVLEKSRKLFTSDDEILDRISKLGETDFCARNITVINDNLSFVPVSVLNAVKKKMLEQLKYTLINSNTKNYYCNAPALRIERKVRAAGKTFIEVCSEKQIIDNLKNADFLIINPPVFSVSIIRGMIEAAGVKCYVKLPKLLRKNDYAKFEAICALIEEVGAGIMAENIYAVHLARQKHIPYIAGFGLNVFNAAAMGMYDDADYVMISEELSLAEMRLMAEAGGVIFASGYLPVMTFAHCPISVCYGADCAHCTHKGEILQYKNEKYTYSIRPTIVNSCQYTLYNALRHNNYAQISELGYNKYISLIGIEDIQSALADTRATSGHFAKGVK